MAELPGGMFQRIVEGAPEAILVADRAGTIIFWNAGAEALFGHPAAEAVGQTLDLIVPEPQRARHWAGYRQVVDAGTSRYGRELLAVPALGKDGSRLSLEFHVVLLRGADGQVEAIAAIIRDVTDRWQRERSLREQVRTLQAALEEVRPPSAHARSAPAGNELVEAKEGVVGWQDLGARSRPRADHR